MKKKFFKWSCLAVVAILLLSVVGCTRAQRPMQNQPGAPAPGANPDNVNLTPDRGMMRDNVPQTPNRTITPDAAPGAPMTRDRTLENDMNARPIATDANRKAQNITNKLTAMEPIENASCVVNGKTALVGIDVADDQQGNNNTQNLKNDLVTKIKKMEPGITNVVITESPDLYQRINNLSKDATTGNTMRGMTNEFTEIMNRIMPATR